MNIKQLAFESLLMLGIGLTAGFAVTLALLWR